jgi:hypothetical protein
MLSVTLQKLVTVFQSYPNGTTSVSTHRYKDMDRLLVNVQEMDVSYPYGREKLRTKNLEQWGFRLKETIWYNTEADHSTIRQIWSRN